MSNSTLATVKVPASTSNYTKGRRSRISKITVHHMAGKLTAKQCGQVFQAKGRGASAHYGVGSDGKVGLYVDEENAAWADANSTSNHKSVTIEVANSKTGGSWPVSDKSLGLLIKLCADIAKRNGLGKLVAGKNLTWHSMYCATTCPGDHLRSKMKYIAEEANRLNGESAAKETSAKEASAKKTAAGSAKRVAAKEAAKSHSKSLSGTYRVTAASGLNVRDGAGEKKKKLAAVPKGTKVQCYGYYTEVSGVKWLYVQLTHKKVEYTGFCSGEYLKKV